MLSKNAPARVRRFKRQEEALKLRIEGKTYREIGTALGVHRTTAIRLVSSALASVGLEIASNREELRNLQAARLESLVAALWPKVQSGDVKAVNVMVNVLNRYARLFGLDAPKTIEATVRNDGLDLSAMSEGQLVEHCRRLGIPVDLLTPSVASEPLDIEGDTKS